MTSQGLRASPEGIRTAKIALTDKTLSQHKLAVSLGITRQPVSKFFAGEPVSRNCFVQICQQLGLSWQKVAGLPENIAFQVGAKVRTDSIDTDKLVYELRQKRQDKIHDQCSTLQMLDIAQPILLSDIYTNINILEEITSQKWLEISELLKDFNPDLNFNRLGGDKQPRSLPGLEAALRYSKLMMLGKPGSGKTTFLQHLAIECNQGKFQPHLIAIFIRLKEFAEDAKSENEFNLLKFISQEFLSCGIDEESTTTILAQGKALVLLDGLDEVPSSQADKVTRELRRFTQYYYKNQFVMSCRIAAQQYKFPGFTEVEVADFNYEQVEVFVKNWFFAVAHKSREDGEATGNLFIHQLNLSENQQIRELAVTPLFLHLICLVFQEKAGFPFNQTKLYEQILNILLTRWDEVKGIKRVQAYHNLTIAAKKQLLYHIAAITFEQGNLFFEQEKIQHIIADYLGNFGNNNTDLSEVLLKEIEVQHGFLVERARGVYSFSHLTLHEYFTAKNIVENHQLNFGENLVNQITKKHWHYILFLTVSMLPKTDEILWLMKHKIDSLVSAEVKIQDFLIWLYQKSGSVSTHYKAVAIRAFYLVCVGRTPQDNYLRERLVQACRHSFVYSAGVVTRKDNLSSCCQLRSFIHTPNYSLECALLGDIAFNPDLALDEFLTSTLTCVSELNFALKHSLKNAIFIDHVHALSIAFNEALELLSESEFKQVLHNLKKELPQTDHNSHNFREWWQTNGQLWGQKLRNGIIKYRNIGHDWQFNQQQIELLHQYYDANKLLVDCLNCAVNITPLIRQEIEETLLLANCHIKH
ncbi:NACHT domain-containing protein [Halotia branconii]|uniref:NACHT domain-containing NTPase n=1 Tax=Halotia branconii CENA392 TaxID=1539056 RepID=A0AAJ6NVD8_9CYAN|nr:NACHT domain-containing NTPase [Halotia branconii]WGV27439.1 NACHT domain-containing NTPase [Halotia branconii CENA392]